MSTDDEDGDDDDAWPRELLFIIMQKMRWAINVGLLVQAW